MISTSQVNDGVIEITKIDTTKFALKSETATKEELQTLSSAVAGKLDSSPIHHHDIADIDQLQTALNDKLSSSQRYSYASLISNPEKIDYLDELKTTELEISASKTDNGFKIITDNNGDLLIMLGNVCVARYDSSSSQWLFSNVNINEVLANHHDAIEALSNGVAPSETSYAPLSHTHAISDVTNLQTTLDGKASSSHTHTEFNNDLTINGALNINSGNNNVVMTGLTNRNEAAIVLGRETTNDNSAFIWYRHDTSPHCLGFTFWGNVNDRFRIYTNGNCVAAGKITATNFELTNQQNYEYIFTCPRVATWSTTGSNKYKRCIIGYFNDYSSDFIIQTGFIKVAVVTTGSSPYGGIREYILYKAYCSTSSTTNIRETSSTIFENENSGRFAIKIYSAANNVKKLELVCDAFDTLDSIGAQITATLPSKLRLYNEQALTNPIGKEKTLTWYYANTQD